MHQHILENSLIVGSILIIIKTTKQGRGGGLNLLTLSKKEPHTIKIRVLVRHFMNHSRKSRRSTEKLREKKSFFNTINLNHKR